MTSPHCQVEVKCLIKEKYEKLILKKVEFLKLVKIYATFVLKQSLTFLEMFIFMRKVLFLIA